jgi:hypothetical protein
MGGGEHGFQIYRQQFSPVGDAGFGEKRVLVDAGVVDQDVERAVCRNRRVGGFEVGKVKRDRAGAGLFVHWGRIDVHRENDFSTLRRELADNGGTYAAVAAGDEGAAA